MRWHPFSLVLVALAVLSAGAVATASEIDEVRSAIESARAERESARAARAEAATDLDGLRASEADLEAAIAVLAEQVTAQTRRVDDARQAVAVAEAEAAAHRDRIGAAQVQAEGLRQRAADRAISAYVRPDFDAVVTLFTSGDPFEASRRAAFLEAVQAEDGDVLEALRAIRVDLAELERQAIEAATEAERQRGALAEELAALEEARADQDRLLADLEVRIEAVRAEIAGFEAAEAELSATITRRQEELDTLLNPPPPPTRSGGVSSSGGGVGGTGQLGWPTGGHITSGFGPRWGRQHQGIDIGAPSGQAVGAAAGGVVLTAGTLSGYGNVVVVDHGGGIVTLYAHLSSVSVSSGQTVSRGQTVGAVGSTGHSTGPHLHFEVRHGGVPQNPLAYL